MPGPIQLSYGNAKSNRKRNVVLLALLIVLATWASVKVAQISVIERRIAQREKKLLAANKPGVIWPAASLAFGSKGELLLPDATPARLAEIKLPDATKLPMTADATFAIQKLRATSIGHTVVGHAADGTPVVQVWVLSPQAYDGMCGNSSHEERCNGGMLLWRNLGVWLATEHQWPMEPSAYNSPVSVIGW